jgi:hypothetical protein
MPKRLPGAATATHRPTLLAFPPLPPRGL